jgi:hypothetical protein
MLTMLENWQTEDEHADAKVAKYAFYFQTTAYCSAFLWGFIWSSAKVGNVDLGCGGRTCYNYLMVKVPTFFFTILWRLPPPLPPRPHVQRAGCRCPAAGKAG